MRRLQACRLRAGGRGEAWHRHAGALGLDERRDHARQRLLALPPVELDHGSAQLPPLEHDRLGPRGRLLEPEVGGDRAYLEEAAVKGGAWGWASGLG